MRSMLTSLSIASRYGVSSFSSVRDAVGDRFLARKEKSKWHCLSSCQLSEPYKRTGGDARSAKRGRRNSD